MRLTRLALLTLSGPLLLAAAWWASRPESPPPRGPTRVPAALAPMTFGLTESQLEALRPLLRRYERLEGRLPRAARNAAWLSERRKTVEVLRASEGDLLPVPRSPAVNEGAEPGCGLSCLPPVGPSPRCPEPAQTAWPHLFRPSRFSPSPWGGPSGPRPARSAALVHAATERLAWRLEEIDEGLRRPAWGEGRPSDILKCTAEAAGVQLTEIEVRRRGAFPELGRDVPLRRLPVKVRAQGTQLALATWIRRLASGPEMWSVVAATLTERDGRHVLHAELELFMQED